MSDIYAAHDAAIERIRTLNERVEKLENLWEQLGEVLPVVVEKQRLVKAQARVAELEAKLQIAEGYARDMDSWRLRAKRKAEAAESRVAELEAIVGDHGEWGMAAIRVLDRAEKSEARVAELEAASVPSLTVREIKILEADRDRWQDAALDLKQQIAVRDEHIGVLNEAMDKDEPPEGHVAVILPREDVENWSSRWSDEDIYPLRARTEEACRKALEADDV